MQTTSVATKSTRTAQCNKVAKALPYPALPSIALCSDTHFWLFAWVRDLAEYEAFRAFIATKAVSTQRGKSERLSMALSGAYLAIEDSLRESTKQVLKRGGILFAFPDSSIFRVVAA